MSIKKDIKHFTRGERIDLPYVDIKLYGQFIEITPLDFTLRQLDMLIKDLKEFKQWRKGRKLK